MVQSGDHKFAVVPAKAGTHNHRRLVVGCDRRSGMYHVYILASRRHGTLYIGVTNSLQKRLEEHRNGNGSSFVKTLRRLSARGMSRLTSAPKKRIAPREGQLKRWKRKLEDRADSSARLLSGAISSDPA